MPTPVLDLESSSMCCYLSLVERLLDQCGILKHFPPSRCIFISHWLREKKQSSIVIKIEGAIWFGLKKFRHYFERIAGVLADLVK